MCALLVGLPEGRGLDLIWSAAVEAGEQVRTLKPLRSTLEEVFLRAIAETEKPREPD